jgi:hypothetical protein
MLGNAISGVRNEKIGVLKSGGNIYGRMSVVLSSVLDSNENGFFAHLHKSGKRTSFSHTKRAKGLH